MKIALVQCPMWGVETPPEGLAYLNAVLKKYNHLTTVFDFNIEFYSKLTKEEKNYYYFSYNELWYNKKKFAKLKFITQDLFYDMANRILKTKPDIVCFSVALTSTVFSLKLAEKIKQIDSSIITIFGGPDSKPEREGYNIIKEPYVDFVVVGEGEIVLLDLIKKLEKNPKYLSDVKCRGCIFLDSVGKVRYLENKKMKELDEVSFPDFSGFNLEKYTQAHASPIMLGRGCTKNCLYCSEAFYWRNYRAKDPKNILAQITYLNRKYNKSFFYFNDCLINANTKNLEKLCDLIISSGLKINWKGKIYPSDELNLNLLKKMKKSGCVDLEWGIETASNRLLSDMGRKYTIEMVLKNIKDAHSAQIVSHTFWMVGFPTESEEDFNMTLDFVKKYSKYMKVDSSSISVFQILFDTPFSKLCDKYNLLLDIAGWRTKDNSNTIDIRNFRAQKFRNTASKLGILSR
jgi:radical SAM superfamily enzyme YgiQ (UPF0313 family)